MSPVGDLGVCFWSVKNGHFSQLNVFQIWDEKEAQEKRKGKVVEFGKALDPEITFDRINALFHKAAEE